jgi:hypothetical protein
MTTSICLVINCVFLLHFKKPPSISAPSVVQQTDMNLLKDSPVPLGRKILPFFDSEDRCGIICLKYWYLFTNYTVSASRYEVNNTTIV